MGLPIKRLALALLLLALPASGQIAISDVDLADVVVTSAVSSAPAEDWADNMVVVFDFEASGDPWMNDVNSSGGSGCDATILTGTPTREVAVFKEGVASALFEDALGENDMLQTSCSDITDLNDGDVSFGAWVYNTADQFDHFVGYNTSSLGWALKRDSSGNTLQCLVNATVHTGQAWTTTDTWVHVGCSYDFSTGEIDSFFNGNDSGAATSGQATLDSRNLRMGGNQGASDEYIDEVYVYQGELLEEDFCRIASCDMDGSLCSCNGTAWVDDGRHTTMSLTCTLPTNCNDAAP